MPRRPLCPYCEYDLSGTFDRFSHKPMRCSECGEQFSPNEVHWTRRPGEWTLAQGLIQLAVSLAWRGIVVIVVLVVGIIAFEAFGSWLDGMTSGEFVMSARVYFLPACALGVAAGMILMRGLPESAGFDSWLIAIAASGAMVLAMSITRQIGYRLIAPSHIGVEMYLFFATGFAVATILIMYFHDYES